MRRRISLLLCAAMLMGTLSGCGEATAQAPQPAVEDAQQTESEEPSDIVKALMENGASFQASMGLGDVLDSVSSGSGIYGKQVAGGNAGGQFTIEDVDYVLIYNPYIYEEREKQNSSNLYTGDFSSQIAVGTNRADDFELDMTATTPAQPGAFDVDVQKGGRAPGIVDTYKVGEKSTFYYHSSVAKNERKKGEFTCEYVGKNCYVWSINGSISAKDAKIFGDEFDNTIFDNDTKAFGDARFTDDGGKVNLLFYSMDVRGICGFFTNADIFSASEVPSDYAEKNGMNLDRAIININTDIIDALGAGEVNATLAHELQHLICASNALENPSTPPVMMSTWLNESMSAYAEELNYPGIKKEADYNICMYPSSNFKKGQSLYNFSIENDEYIGAYGAVYLFEEFLRHYEGDGVLSAIHNYWRTKPSQNLTVSEALMDSVSASFADEIADIEYPAEISKGFASEADEWMSKLTLEFFVETLSPDLADLKDYSRDLRELMVYDEKNATDIEGGGRVIVATQGGSYTVPADASADLVYLGLDKDFNLVTDVITAYSSGLAQTSGSDVSSSDTNTGSAISYDADGYFEFSYNNKPKAYVFSDGSVSDSAIDTMVESGFAQLEGSRTEKVVKSSLDEINTELEKIMNDDKKLGFVTVLVPKKASKSEWSDFAAVSEQLISKGVYVSIVSNDYPDTFPYPWCFVLACKNKGVKNLVEAMPEAVGTTILSGLIDCYDGEEKCPLICSPSD